MKDKDAIIKNGITYKVVRMLYVPGCGQEVPCEKCDLARTCNRPDGQILMPCEMFHKGNHLAYFKKDKKTEKNEQNCPKGNWKDIISPNMTNDKETDTGTETRP